jgi:hypothetical protein
VVMINNLINETGYEESGSGKKELQSVFSLKRWIEFCAERP